MQSRVQRLTVPAGGMPALLPMLQRIAVWVRPAVRAALMPIIGIAVFLAIWQGAASQINTSLGQFPGPAEVWEQAQNLKADFMRDRERAAAFDARQRERHEAILAENPDAELRVREYRGSPTFPDQVLTSLKTVLTGFALASIIAIPLGIAIGLSRSLNEAMNPVIQLFKPVSPLAWLPLVTLVVSAVYVSSDPMFERSFVVSVLCVMLCSLWPTLVNTAVGAAGVSSDLKNVSQVLRLGYFRHVVTIVIPSSIPMVFAGLRSSLGVAWMVLIATEMLSQNPGLGKFIWDEFQNGSSDSLGRIMVAVIAIGGIGFLLDRSMLALQRALSWDRTAVLR